MKLIIYIKWLEWRKEKIKMYSLLTVIENREVELKVHRTDERALLRFI